MPFTKRFNNARLRVNDGDHAPPHFHVLMNDGREAWVTIEPIAIIHGKVKAREISEVLTWAKTNQALLAATFEELQQ